MPDKQGCHNGLSMSRYFYSGITGRFCWKAFQLVPGGNEGLHCNEGMAFADAPFFNINYCQHNKVNVNGKLEGQVHFPGERGRASLPANARYIHTGSSDPPCCKLYVGLGYLVHSLVKSHLSGSIRHISFQIYRNPSMR